MTVGTKISNGNHPARITVTCKNCGTCMKHARTTTPGFTFRCPKCSTSVIIQVNFDEK